MKKIWSALAVLSLFLLPSVWGEAEIPPYYPAPQPVMPQKTAIAPGEVKFTLPNGSVVAAGEFNRSRSLNGTWLCSGLENSPVPFPPDEKRKDFEKPGFDDSKWDNIPVPLDWYQKYTKIYDAARPYVRGYYRHEIELSADEIKDHSVLLHFGVIGYEATLWVNGREVGSHHGEFIPWTADITKFVKPGKNLIALRVVTDFGPSRSDVKAGTHTYGSQWSVPNIKGGIWQDVELRIESPVRVERLLVNPRLDSDSVQLDYRIVNNTGKTLRCNLGAAVTEALKTAANRLNAAAPEQAVELAPGVNSGSVTVKLNKPVRWDLDNPHLYYATLYLSEGGKPVTAKSERFGFREFRIQDGKFHLNGRRVYLFGENLRSVNFGGRGKDDKDRSHLYAKLSGFKSLGYNIIRNAHMPALKELGEIADEIGLMVYNEWGWCFTNVIDEPEFARRNPVELEEWLVRDYNHPSTVMWCGGNEVVHRNNPAIQRQLDRQVDQVRAFEQSGRPVGSFSGSASWGSYGTDPRNTDFLDLHSYVGLGGHPWTSWTPNFNMLYNGSLSHYKIKGDRVPMPYIIWECVGFSWGGATDKNFKQNDIKRYADYVDKPSSWAQGNGIGFAGTLGLFRALQPGSLDEGKRIYGKRVLEQVRQDDRVDGFAPWFHGYQLDAATLWTQPVLIGLRNGAGLPPRSFFSGRKYPLELFLANQDAAKLEGAVARIRLLTAPEKSVELGEFKIPAVAPFEIAAVPATFEIPVGISGHCQLRLDLVSGGKELSRNFYNVFIQPESLLETPVKTDKKIALLDTGSAKDVETTGAILKSLGVPFEVISGKKVPTGFQLAIIPASLDNRGKLALDGAALLNWVRGGGTLLVLEQNSFNGSLIANTNILAQGNTFIDLIFPEHPVFRGLDQRNFDSWDNPNLGYVCEGALSPFSRNAIAAKGPMLGRRNVESAILEATMGKGHLYWSQLSAVKLWGKDSSASTYLVNLLDYLLNGKRYAKVAPLELNTANRYIAAEKNLVPVDLRKFTNRSFSDETDGDGKGGWTDQGSNDFRNMPLGKQRAAGVLFEVIDPAKNNGTGCIVLAGLTRPKFPTAAKGIPVNAKFSRMFFLHTAAWDGPDAGRYRIRYADGGTVDYELIPGKNIGDWWNCGYLSDAMIGLLAPNPTREQVGTYVACWENPQPEREIASFDFLSPLYREDGSINYDLSKTPVPVLVAVTGETYNPDFLTLDSAKKPGTWQVGNTLKEGARGTAVRTPEGVRIDLPPCAAQSDGTPYAFLRFDPGTFDHEKASYLSFRIKALTPGTIDLSLAEKNWKGAYRTTLETGTPGEWRKVRVPLAELESSKQMKGMALRGELFLYNGNNRNVAFPRPATSFLIDDITLE